MEPPTNSTYIMKMFSLLQNLEMGPDPTRAYFWLAVNSRTTCLWPGYFLTRPKDISMSQREKIEKFGIFRWNFPNPDSNHRWLTWPTLTQVKIFWPGSITTIFINFSNLFFHYWWENCEWAMVFGWGSEGHGFKF